MTTHPQTGRGQVQGPNLGPLTLLILQIPVGILKFSNSFRRVGTGKARTSGEARNFKFGTPIDLGNVPSHG